MPFKKGDLVWWIAPSGKYWGIVSKIYKARSRAYVVCHGAGSEFPLSSLRHTSENAIIRRQRKVCRIGAPITRQQIARVRELAAYTGGIRPAPLVTATTASTPLSSLLTYFTRNRISIGGQMYDG